MFNEYFPQYKFSLLQRMGVIWIFIACGLVIAVQLSQSWAEPRPRWTLLNAEQKPYWYTYYVFFAFLLAQISYGPLRWKMEGLLWGYEVEILDGIWIGLLGLEALMLFSVLVLKVMRTMKSASKLKKS